MRFQDLFAFPKEEKYFLADQIERSSRSVTANISESYRKMKYPKNFISKLTNSDGGNSETQIWLEFVLTCNYINQDTFDNLFKDIKEVGKLINYMTNDPDKFGRSEILSTATAK